MSQTTELLIEAFRRACHGYSLDRVVADPKLQDELVRHGNELRLAGDAKSWNTALFRLRKAGKLNGVPTTARTELPWEECESFLPAAEAATSLLLGRDEEESLDDLLCDPARAAEFDRLAVRYGGKKAIFEYRWTALKLRKEARVIRRRAAELRRTELRFTVPIALARGGKLKSLPAESGLYALYDGEGERLYVGAAMNVRERLVRLLPKTRLKLFDRQGDVRVAVCPLAASWTDLLAHRQSLVAKSPTTLNWRLPGDDDSHDDETSPSNGLASQRRRRAVAETAHG